MKRDLEQLVAQLTLTEKATLCTGANAWQTVAVERLGIPAITVSDGPHGVRRVTEMMSNESRPATCFPTASALAASWDVELLQQLGHALAEECLALDVDILLGPGNNMKRAPLCGRNFEYFSEDPFLSGELAASYIQALQSRGVGTSLKHYAANNQEFQRFVIDAQIDERALREIYLAGFERAVKQSQPWTVMCAYNRVNGDYCSEHARLLNSILKEEWGFKGFVVSDWGAVHDRVAALAGGLDLEMPGPRQKRVQSVIEAIQAGELDEQIVDAAVKRLLRVIFKAVETPKDAAGFDKEAHHQLARKIAGESLVLLKNEDGLLPLQAGQKLALIGSAAREAHFQGGGSSHINPTRVDNPFEEIAALAGEVELLFAPGYRAEPGRDQDLIDAAVSCAQEAEVALLYIALPSYIESEGYDRPNMRLTAQQEALIQAVAAVQPQTVVILNNGSAIEMREWIDQVPAVLEAWMMGQAGGGAIADVLFGQVNPSGKLAETFPLRLADTPAYLNFPGENGVVRYGEGLFIGYRYYDARQQAVLFPFGYGLSYTTFAYSQLRVSAEKFNATDGLQVSVDVTNTGEMAGKEIVQLYVHDQESRLVRPEKELKGFAKVTLAPGETQTVTLELDARAFAYYDPAYKQWITESGAFDILVGRSSADICLQATVQLESTQELPCILTKESTIREWLADSRGAQVLQPLLQQVFAQVGEEGTEGINAEEAMRFAADMPLEPILDWFGGKLPSTSEQIITQLLAQLER
ncbi:MAG: glycoside hydrolase family 3 C-terminal domain-containing protein [Chloroflexota bacterium]|nr:glycoside hydrolase family 3 C-terminal domain-containing protein [Chloroflexota bacterium]